MKKTNKATRYVRIFADVYEHPAVLTLPGSAFKLWFDLITQFKGFNNGRLVVTLGEQATRGWNSTSKLLKARDELLARGLLKATKYCGPNVFHKATLYALTHLDVAASEVDGIVGSAATHDYRVFLRSPESGRQRFLNQESNVSRIRKAEDENVSRIRKATNDAQVVEGEKVSTVSPVSDPAFLKQEIHNHIYQVGGDQSDGAAVAVAVAPDLDSPPLGRRKNLALVDEFAAPKLRRESRDERSARRKHAKH